MTHILRIGAWSFIAIGSALTAIWLAQEAALLLAAAMCFILATVCICKLEELEKP